MKKENNKISCHSRGSLPGIYTLIKQSGGDPRLQTSGMTNGAAKGFTLLEILIAVIIIAVLATVAVSAYQKAVLKSRFSGLMPLAKTLAQGNEEYYLRNGQYTDDVNKLDIKATGNSKTQITLGNEKNHKYVLLTRDDMKNQLRMYQQKSKNFPGETHCEALIDDSLANWLCRDALKGTLVGNKYGYTVYSLSDEAVGTLARSLTFPDYQAYVSDGDYCLNCYQGVFKNGSWCIGRNCQFGKFYNNSVAYNGAGNGGTYDHSYCVANGAWYCELVYFNNHSVCYANASGTCTRATYDDTSCCTGSYCPKKEDTCAYKNITPPAQPVYK